MKVIAISDTHGLHHELQLPEGDLLVHTGDVSMRGTEAEIKDFLVWFTAQPHPYKVFIAGNHDFYFEGKSKEELQEIIPSNIHYLNESGVEIEGVSIWGTPFTPIPNRRWAFNEERGDSMQKHWDLIPPNLDILLVHGPAYGILDRTTKEEYVGCKNLRKTLQEQQPKKVIFGHIHESRGIQQEGKTEYINASSVDRYRTRIYEPFVFEI